LSGIPRNKQEGTAKDKFWKEFQLKYEEKLGRAIDFEDFHQRHHRLEHPKQFLANFFGFRSKYELDQYQKEMEIFFEVLKKMTETPHMIDSSKYAPRALNLGRLKASENPIAYELCFVYLRRDPVSVIRSFQKQVKEQVSRHWLSANIYYFLINLFCSLTLSRLKSKGYKTLKVRYEDYTQNPIQTLGKIEAAFEVDLTQTKSRIQNKEDLEIGHLFDGNRLRIKESIRLKKGNPVKCQGFVDYFSRVFNKIWY